MRASYYEYSCSVARTRFWKNADKESVFAFVQVLLRVSTSALFSITQLSRSFSITLISRRFWGDFNSSPPVTTPPFAQGQVDDIFHLELSRLGVDPQIHHQLHDRPHARHRGTNGARKLFHQLSINTFGSLPIGNFEVLHEGLNNSSFVFRF